MRVIRSYLGWKKEKLRLGVYEDVAYIEGYINGLTYLIANRDQRELRRIPLYYMFGVHRDIVSLAEFKAALKQRPKAHKASFARASRFLRRLSSPNLVEFHHPPWL